jgi:hypothetical protein
MKKPKNRYILGGVLSSISLSVLSGIFLSGLLKIDSTPLKIAIMVVLAVSLSAFAIRDKKSGVMVEGIAYAVAILLLTQASWDWYANDWNILRAEIAIPALISLAINTLTGNVRLSGMGRTFKNQIGLK